MSLRVIHFRIFHVIHFQKCIGNEVLSGARECIGANSLYVLDQKKSKKCTKVLQKKINTFSGGGVICIENSVFENVLTFRDFRKCIGISMPPPGSKPENVLKTFLKGHVNFLIHSPNM